MKGFMCAIQEEITDLHIPVPWTGNEEDGEQPCQPKQNLVAEVNLHEVAPGNAVLTCLAGRDAVGEWRKAYERWSDPSLRGGSSEMSLATKLYQGYTVNWDLKLHVSGQFLVHYTYRPIIIGWPPSKTFMEIAFMSRRKRDLRS